MENSVCYIKCNNDYGRQGEFRAVDPSYGGPYEDIIRSRIIEPFEKEFNVKVTYDAVGSASQDYAKIKATRGRPGFDVVVMTASQSLDGCRDNLLEKFSTETVPNIAKLNPEISGIAGACGAVHEIQYLSLLWRKDKLAKAPVSWSAFFDEELKGKVILPTFQNIMAAYLMQIMSVTNGGDLMDNVDPGFEAMGRLASQSMGFEGVWAPFARVVRMRLELSGFQHRVHDDRKLSYDRHSSSFEADPFSQLKLHVRNELCTELRVRFTAAASYRSPRKWRSPLRDMCPS